MTPQWLTILTTLSGILLGAGGSWLGIRSKLKAAKGRSGNSAHTRGLAVDIRCNTSANRWRIIRAAMNCGITRIGVGRSFVHLDTDPTLPQGVIWHYYDE